MTSDFRNSVVFMTAILNLVVAFFCWENATGASLSGRWEGSAAVSAMEMKIGVDPAVRGKTASASVDLPDAFGFNHAAQHLRERNGRGHHVPRSPRDHASSSSTVDAGLDHKMRVIS